MLNTASYDKLIAPWSKGTSQFDVAELKLIQWRRSIETRAQRAITVQLDVYCSCFAARLP